MKDRFKFRAWDIEEKKMNYFQNKRGMQYNNDEIRISNGWDGYDNPKYWGEDDEDYVDRTDKYILMQSTGLKDRNGKLIYEGDIVKVSGYGVEGIFKMFWEDVTAQFAINVYESDCFEHSQSVMEVIGNIYENKELLEEQK